MHKDSLPLAKGRHKKCWKGYADRKGSWGASNVECDYENYPQKRRVIALNKEKE